MAIIKANIADWEDIFLDTSIIINLLLAQRGTTDTTSLFVNKLISFLSKSKRKDGKKDRTFYFSAISLSEILSDESDKGRMSEIINAIGGKDTEVIAFDDTIALQILQEIAPLLSHTSLNRFAKEIGWKTHELVMAREWINRDFMIAMSGKNRDVNVVLTTDYRTLYPICGKIDVFCALAYPDLYNSSGEAVFEYYSPKASAFVDNKLNPPKKEKKGTEAIK